MTQADDNNISNPPDAEGETGADTQNPPTIADFNKLQEERDQLYDRFVRATADYKNSQRRIEQEKEQAVQYGNSQLIKSILPVIDNFERALAVDLTKTDAAKLQHGMQIVHDQLMKVLKQQHVEEIAPEPGTVFDPNHHEALMQQPSDEYDQPTVTQLLQKGYMLHDRTLRPAGVAVSQPK